MAGPLSVDLAGALYGGHCRRDQQPGSMDDGSSAADNSPITARPKREEWPENQKKRPESLACIEIIKRRKTVRAKEMKQWCESES
jgi:hypothetical protein